LTGPLCTEQATCRSKTWCCLTGMQVLGRLMVGWRLADCAAITTLTALCHHPQTTRSLNVEELKSAFIKQSASAALSAVPGESAVEDTASATDLTADSTAAATAPQAELSLAPAGAGGLASPATATAAVSGGQQLPADASDGLEAGPVTLEIFQKLLLLLTSQTKEMEALAAHCDVGSVRVDASRLKAALLPWPERRLRELREMLPSLAGGARLIAGLTWIELHCCVCVWGGVR